MAHEASPVPGGARDGGRDPVVHGGARDGGRDTVMIEAFSLDDVGAHVPLDSAFVEVTAEGMSAYYAMKRSSIKFESTEMVRRPLRAKREGGKADGNVVWPNVNLALTTVMPGDTRDRARRREWRRWPALGSHGCSGAVYV